MDSLREASRVLGERIHDGPALAFFILMLVLIVGPRLAERVRLPAMVGLVLVGMAVGPHALKLLETKEIALSAWGTFGLLYLMFAAGLELDLKLLMRMKKAAITFAALSFAIPLILGVISAKLLGYAWAAAVLMGSNWASHTLVTYPMLRRMGLARNRAVATVVGATSVTDTSALLVLTGVVASVKGSGGLGVQALEIAAGLGALGLWTLLALPRIARLFFARVGTDHSYRFVFGMTALLSGAVLAQMASIDGIVGAFFAGLGLNRAIPERSPLMDRVQFFGSSLFIPIFLVSVGILLDPDVLVEPKTIVVALVFTAAVLGGKSLAAVVAGRVFHFRWSEIGVMSGLSGSQAAATLATTLVGAKLGIFDKETINAVLVVILLTLVVTPAVVSYFGKRVPREEAHAEDIGRAVFVPVIGDSSRPILGLAGRLAASDNGIVLAASIAIEDASESELAAQRSLTGRAEEWLAKSGLESRTLFHVSRSLEAGIFQGMRSEGATLLVAEWSAPNIHQLGENNEAYRLATRSHAPVLLVHGAVEQFERIVVLVREDDLVRPASLDLDVGLAITNRLARHHRVLFVGASIESVITRFPSLKDFEHVPSAHPISWVRENSQKAGDLLVLAGVESTRQALEGIADLADRTFFVVIGSHGGQLQRREENRSTGVVVGRSLTSEGS